MPSPRAANSQLGTSESIERTGLLLAAASVKSLADGSYGFIEIKLGGDDSVAKGVATVVELADKIDTKKMKKPSFKMVLTAHGDFVYPYKDTGVLICPISCLKGSELPS